MSTIFFGSLTSSTSRTFTGNGIILCAGGGQNSGYNAQFKLNGTLISFTVDLGNNHKITLGFASVSNGDVLTAAQNSQYLGIYY